MARRQPAAGRAATSNAAAPSAVAYPSASLCRTCCASLATLAKKDDTGNDTAFRLDYRRLARSYGGKTNCEWYLKSFNVAQRTGGDLVSTGDTLAAALTQEFE